MSTMVYFFLSVLALVAGYLIYGRIVERLFGADQNRETPVSRMADGVDYVCLPSYKVFLIQLLNIAGVGPIFGPILGALYGPWALVWIVLGSIFAGGVHDYFSGMLSLRYDGKSIPDVVGYNLGNIFKQFMQVFSVVLLLLVGVVFVTSPAKLLANITDWNHWYWVGIIFAYYFLATVLPIDKIIGRIYPLFAVVLVFMAVGLMAALIWKGYAFYPAAAWTNQHPDGLPLWPLMFVTIACGALSGFHATQSPMMARCMLNERHGRGVFYGAMIAEGVIALIWATLGMTFYHSPELLNAAIKAGSPAKVVQDISVALLGKYGGLLAILGVIILPISSGDTAFRAARLTIADFFKYSQKEKSHRLLLAVPLFVLGAILTQVQFDIIWRYFGWANQTLATVVLWAAGAYLVRRGSIHWIATIPAVFMTAVCSTYLLYAKIGFSMPLDIASYAGIAIAVGSMLLFLANCKRFAADPVK